MVDQQVKTSTIPQAIQDIWLADYQRALTYNIRKKYGLSFDDRSAIEQTIDALFKGDLKVADLANNLKTQKIGTTQNTQAIIRDIIGYCLLPAKDYFRQQGQDLEKILTESGGVDKVYTDNISVMNKAIAEEQAGTYDHDKYVLDDTKKVLPVVNEKPETIEGNDSDDLSTEDIKVGLINFFDDGLNDLLSLESGDMLETINEELIEVLTNNEKYKKEIETYLLGTKITIGTTNLNLADKEVPPISANWLKDFFSVAGADSFDTLSIAKYIISSPNAKNLSEDEQAKLRRFLTLYHNIHFFPAPFTALPVEKWEVIPGAHTNLPTKIEDEKVLAPSPKRQPKWSVTPKTETSTAPVTRSKSQELIDLEKMRDQYAIGTLERAAIEEEIKHFDQAS